MDRVELIIQQCPNLVSIPHMRILLSYWMRAMCQGSWQPVSL